MPIIESPAKGVTRPNKKTNSARSLLSAGPSANGKLNHNACTVRVAEILPDDEDTRTTLLPTNAEVISGNPPQNLALPSEPIIIDISSDPESEAEENRLKITHFAYGDLPKTKPVTPILRSTSSPAVEKASTSAAPVLKPSRKAQKHQFADELSDNDLARLKNCVCCSVAWTTRKGAAQKVTHMLSCAKKHAFTDDMILDCIRREVDKEPVEMANTAKAKGKQKATEPEAAFPTTYVEEVLQGAEQKRKGRRPDVSKTVKSLVETREGILDKARIVLGGEPVANTLQTGSCLETYIYGSSRGPPPNISADFPPATQVAGASNLGQMYAPNKPSIFSDMTGDDARHILPDENAFPPSTQAFVPSKLGTFLGSSSAFRSPSPTSQNLSPEGSTRTVRNHHFHPLVSETDNIQTRSPSLGTIPVSLTSRDPTRPLHMKTSTENEKSPGLTALSMNSEHDPADIQYVYSPESDNDPAWADDAILHYDPHPLDQSNHSVSYISQFQTSPIISHTTKRVPQTISPKRKTLHTPTSSVRKKKGSKARTANDAEAPFDEEWEAWLRQRILQDEALHLRVLRLEVFIH